MEGNQGQGFVNHNDGISSSNNGSMKGLANRRLQRPWLHQQAATVAIEGQLSQGLSSSSQNVYQGSSSSSSSYERATPSTTDGESEDFEMVSDIVLKYINDMLMNEDMEDRKCMYHECSALQATVKPFYDILGENYPPCVSGEIGQERNNYDSWENQSQGLEIDVNKNGGRLDERNWIGQIFDMFGGLESPLSGNFSTDYSSQLSLSSSSSSNVIDDSPIYEMSLRELFSEAEQSVFVGKEFEKASYQVLPKENVGIGSGRVRFWRVPKQESDFEFKLEKEDMGVSIATAPAKGLVHGGDENGSKQQRHKNPHRDDLDLQDRQSNKHSAVYTEKVIRTEKFDEVLLCHAENGRNFSVKQKEVLQNGVQKVNQNGSAKGVQGGRSRGKRQGKREVVDLRTLLVHCAQAVATDDNRGANEVLKQIRQHASPYGDGSQRLAHYFAESLVARLSGTGGRLYTMLSNNTPSAAEILKAYHLHISATPFKKITHFLANKTILKVAEKATRLHIVDFGILYGFQWPCLMQNLSRVPGGPPKLRITGIDLPQPGFRPAERVEETGRRLADYAESFGVPFEYQAIAIKWENLDIADLEFNDDELLVVNCMSRMRNLMDETVVVESPRNIVLNKIRSMNPHIFIHGVVNGAYSAPFFITRFREALFHYSALFDALETTVPREHPERMVLEKDIFGREILNVVACEGLERVERPETYKQWQVRTRRAGFVQLPLDRNILSKARERAKSLYDKDFGVDEDGNWLLLGWKGRIMNALCIWTPSS